MEIEKLNYLLFFFVEKERLNEDEIGDDTITKRLKVDYLKQTGKFKQTVADQYTGADSFVVLRCKEHKSSVTCLCVTSDDRFLFSGSKCGSIVKCKGLLVCFWGVFIYFVIFRVCNREEKSWCDFV